ncbi:MAG: cohesin domain-containing protein [Pyrinomonadaceae bacterium]
MLQQEAIEDQQIQLAAARRAGPTVAKVEEAPPSPATTTASPTAAEVPAYLPAPKVLAETSNITGTPGAIATNASNKSRIEVDFVGRSAPAIPIIGKPAAITTPILPGTTTPRSGTAQVSFAGTMREMHVGERQMLALALQTEMPIALAMIKLGFDPSLLAVRAVKEGGLLSSAATAPRLLHSTDASGSLTLSVTPDASSMLKGAGVLVFVEVEALRGGTSFINFQEEMVRLIGGDGRAVPVQISNSSLVVK